MTYEPIMRSRDELDRLVDTVIEAFNEMDDELLMAIGEALVVTDEHALKDLGDTFRMHVWAENPESALTHIRTRSWLDLHAGDELLLQRLEAATDPPWPALRSALVAAGEI